MTRTNREVYTIFLSYSSRVCFVDIVVLVVVVGLVRHVTDTSALCVCCDRLANLLAQRLALVRVRSSEHRVWRSSTNKFGIRTGVAFGARRLALVRVWSSERRVWRSSTNKFGIRTGVASGARSILGLSLFAPPFLFAHSHLAQTT